MSAKPLSVNSKKLGFVGRLVCVLAPVAQRIERLTTDQKVGGSNPFGRAITSPP